MSAVPSCQYHAEARRQCYPVWFGVLEGDIGEKSYILLIEWDAMPQRRGIIELVFQLRPDALFRRVATPPDESPSIVEGWHASNGRSVLIGKVVETDLGDRPAKRHSEQRLSFKSLSTL
jgi:hypothetical protein